MSEENGKELKEGDTVYMVEWREGVPFVLAGKIIMFGKGRKSRRAKMADGRLLNMINVQCTIRSAIRHELAAIANVYTTLFHRRNRKVNHFELLGIVAEVSRLVNRLERHNLMDRCA